MKKTGKTTIISKIVTWAIIPGLLVVLWLVFSLLFTSKYPLTVLVSSYDKENIQAFTTNEILAKQSRVGSFQAKENNLGIVSVRFYNFKRISNDKVIFRLKEHGKKDWYYSGEYKVNQFQPDQLFTFGFPVIRDSKGKTYNFEIISQQGRRGDAVGLSGVYPPFVAQYQFPKSELLADKAGLPGYVYKKIAYSFSDRNFFIASLIFLLPLLFYLTWCFLAQIMIHVIVKPYPHIGITTKRSFFSSRESNYLLFQVFFVMVVIVIFFLDERNMYVSLILILLWFWLTKLYQYESNVSYLLATFFLALSPVLLITNNQVIAQRSAIFAFFFLFAGAVIGMLELRNTINTRIGYQDFLKLNVISLKRVFLRK